MPAFNTLSPNIGLNVNNIRGDERYRDLNFKMLDVFVQGVVTAQLNTPAASPVDGTTTLVGAAPTGVFAGQANKIARFNANTNGWDFFTAKPGHKFYNLALAKDQRMIANGTWVTLNDA